jgi:hypothetical protein
MADLSLKGLDEELMVRVKVAALDARVTMRAFVVKVLEEATYNGNVKSRAEGGVGQNYGKTGATGRTGNADVQDADEEAGGLPEAGGSKDVRGVRSNIREHRKPQRGHSGDGTGKVLGSHDTTQPESGAVGNGPRADSGRQGEGKELSVVDRPYFGPEHAKNCICPKCILKRTK